MKHAGRAARRLVAGLALTLTGATGSAHGGEAPFALEEPAIEETTRLLRRDTNFVLLYSPGGGVAHVRIYRDRGEPDRMDVGAADTNEAGGAPGQEREQPERLRDQALASQDADERSAALHGLLGSELGLRTALDVLVRDKEPDVLKSALDVLTGYPALPLEPILTVVRSEHPGVRIQALELLTLHRARDPRVDEVLARAAATDDDEDVRESARSLIGLRVER